ncbi:PEP-CTERM sorting domain-containing protein [Leptolyngbya sp. GGD]|uniref:PEP-CTERM sorting domain-containing protein n=1 Tax=Leptolyngbya sp. GGD TaxID=2997907 RepID=UPI00227D1C35|nr:PEP-CTERM sorting domain-containing protein [Leptolyngbya sp. GGD]MCY6493744.1 PEP-CTERM sorting domain-containing protein [Leptolyngbya sp. GGD]
MRTAVGILAGLSLTLAATQVQAQTLNLYDGSRNTSFAKQGWTSVTPPGTEIVSNGGTTFNTRASNTLQGGYSIFRTLDRTKGYTLGFNLQLLSEAHQNPDRAGFSIIALSSDRRGIELGFWASDAKLSDRIWAQNDGATKPPRFTHAEGTSFNPVRAVRYDLSVQGNYYGLFANGNFQTPILTGSLRNYSPEGVPYNLPNFVFFGDNTTSASASVRITRVDLTPRAIPFANSTARAARLAVDVTAVPEPSTLLGSGIAIMLGGLVHRKRRK